MESMTHKKILVAGDIMIDNYHYGKALRVSPEAPVMIFRESNDGNRTVAGGAANVAVNLKAKAGMEVDIFSVIGDDTNGEDLLTILEEQNIGTEFVISVSGRPTTSKLRYIAQNNQQLMRVDDESTDNISEELLHNDWDKLYCKMNEYDMVILSDYQKGFLTEENTQYLIRIAKEAGIPVLVDVKGTDLEKYRGAYLLKPNQSELHDLTGMPVSNSGQIAEAAVTLCRRAECAYVLATLGASGMVLADQDRVLFWAKSTAKEVYDVTGAGDTVIAYLALGLMEEKGIELVVKTANYAAGIQVSKIGTSIVYPEEVQEAMGMAVNHGKQLNFYRPNGLKCLECIKSTGKKIVFTNGCFDILHAGHVEYLRKAKALGDCLVIGVNSDASIKRLKGESRPVNSLSDRIVLLSALEFVDYVIAFEEDTPYELIQAIKPNILVKGGDYQVKDIVGADLVKENGGSVMTIPLVEGRSTTGIIKKIKKA